MSGESFAFFAPFGGKVPGRVQETLLGSVLRSSTFWGLALAYRFRDMRGAAIMQLTFFLALFLSDAQTPLSVMEGWLHGVARVNPFTNILRLGRQGFLGDVTWANTWGGLVAIAAICALTLWFAVASLNRLRD